MGARELMPTTESNPNLHAHAGRTLFEILFEQADYKYADLMEMDPTWSKDEIAELLGDSKEDHEHAEQIAAYWELRGKLAGLSFALAFFRAGDVERANVSAIKEELAERYSEAEDD